MDEAKTIIAIARTHTDVAGSATATTASGIVIIVANMIARDLAKVRIAESENIQWIAIAYGYALQQVSSFLIVFVGTA